MESLVKKFTQSSLALPLVALAVLLLFNAFFVDDFFKIEVMENGNLYGRPIDILYRASSLIILALGMTFVIATGGIDISVGAVVAISSATCCVMLGGDISGIPEHPFFVAILASLCVGIVAGIWNGTLVAKLKIQAMVATLILMTAGRGIAQLMTDGQIITVYYKPFAYIGGNIPGVMLPTAMIIALAMVLLVLFINKRTSIGLMIQSVGINANAARYAGIKVTAVLFAVYIFSGFCAGTAGLIEGSLIRAADANNAGLNMEMDAILAVTLGGTLMVGGRYYIGGTIIGAITIQTLTTTMYAIGVSSDRLPAVKAIVILLIIVFQSEKFKEMYRNYKLKRLDAQLGSKKEVTNA
ncbi:MULTISPECIES: ABC transporter permease [Succinivibrio]|jgi:simple sugar transport system permease protein|uniref:Simple sugar transport system permease protein n=1 Tax=Succinivibrio dextrinosolvens TaxID=83771 RepID=A0A662Z8X0_9GAMM|nr:ABC transporter permease [Succinivibrio dextrinosolvens]MBQ3883727.1 ABC transporter permease [Succinivibrio sp.]SFK06864.1 simple sugar transport system permease protein [Succinivibrio dextrinosolvens]